MEGSVKLLHAQNEGVTAAPAAKPIGDVLEGRKRASDSGAETVLKTLLHSVLRHLAFRTCRWCPNDA